MTSSQWRETLKSKGGHIWKFMDALGLLGNNVLKNKFEHWEE
jgi:hypothetical protein